MKKTISVLLVASALLAAESVAAAPQSPPVRRRGYLTWKAMTSSRRSKTAAPEPIVNKASIIMMQAGKPRELQAGVRHTSSRIA